MIDETTLATIFSKPPPFTEEELKIVIQKYRENREQFLSGAKVVKTKAKAKAAGVGPSINLDDIEL